ncbi:hypothetical protein A2215_04790 [Candidatus Berkelbacteria bacterium RIFOXYA2_FULL_43_10]|uniref:Uncharacterized protein n=1 Tax=Candidatus Berkelbacteria bacterium RIFOXYA2_FULL_43_10 TaxID=1797472 RepID=A0A1F5EC95_9BACT|nr:MAG: hypothetical protein A2215_04790 [Candidatus Berkelbacteria bacterium RIFOXYA2_FULL_43_10]
MKIRNWKLKIGQTVSLRATKRSAAIFVLVSLCIVAGVIAALYFSHREPARALGTTKYAVNAGGNWQDNGTWSTVATKDASRVADTVAPTAEDDVVLDDYSGAVTIGATSVAKSLDMVGGGTYGQTLTHNAFTLTVSGSVKALWVKVWP